MFGFGEIFGAVKYCAKKVNETVVHLNEETKAKIERDIAKEEDPEARKALRAYYEARDRSSSQKYLKIYLDIKIFSKNKNE